MNRVSYLEQKTMEDIATKTKATLANMLETVEQLQMYQGMLINDDVTYPTQNALDYMSLADDLKVDIKYLQGLYTEALKIKTYNL